MVVDPKITWQSGRFHQIPWMTGVVEQEGAVRAACKCLKKVNPIIMLC